MVGNGPVRVWEQTLAPWAKELNNELHPKEQWKTLIEVKEPWGDTKAFTIQSFCLGNSRAQPA